MKDFKRAGVIYIGALQPAAPAPRDHGALILAVGGTLAALGGSIGVEWAAWAARIMLAANLLTITLSIYRSRASRRAQLR